MLKCMFYVKDEFAFLIKNPFISLISVIHLFVHAVLAAMAVWALLVADHFCFFFC